jgi:hypothetical protein
VRKWFARCGSDTMKPRPPLLEDSCTTSGMVIIILPCAIDILLVPRCTAYAVVISCVNDARNEGPLGMKSDVSSGIVPATTDEDGG